MGGVLAFWVIFAIIVAVAASSRGRSAAGWFLISILLSPILALILVLVLPNLAAQELEEAHRRRREAELATVRRVEPPPAPSVPSAPDPMALLSMLGQARDRGLISPEEFADKKRQLLERI